LIFYEFAAVMPLGVRGTGIAALVPVGAGCRGSHLGFAGRGHIAINTNMAIGLSLAIGRYLEPHLNDSDPP